MFNLFYVVFCALTISAFAAPLTEEEASAQLRAAGMTQASIDGLDALTKRFFSEYPLFSITKEEANAELRAAGMTQASIDGLDALAKRFSSEFLLVKSDKEATGNYIVKYRTDAENYIKLMPKNDQTVYNNYLKKNF
ncbi:hypothetical protein L5515_008997 [Caenorhabditis briggsae]|uniref:DUF4783 domain-containing protein n=1 Tax=Caenorhabditis briggsae TaxID=6238 RepID=A0AAE9F7P6_CAEBR|nr:hypothetical protein L5515_008997 [Caenorhabditis briggsae]